MKKFIASKLTLYNIAPKVYSVGQTSDASKMEIIWIPNGSNVVKNGNFHANNCFVVKVFDENMNEIYQSEEVSFSVDYNVRCYDYIDIPLWSQLVEDKKCTTTFYICVVGYRYDSNENDVVKKSGPYYSEYFFLCAK